MSTDIPEPDRAGGVIYVCPEHVQVHEALTLRTCGHPFIFRSSYERHWREEHGDVTVDYEPGAMQGKRILGSWAPRTQVIPEVALSADPRHGPLTHEPFPWTEVDRKEATARLDTYLEQTKLRTPRGIGKSHPAVTAAGWMGMPHTVSIPVTDIDPETVRILTGAHDVDVQLCCEDPNCSIRYHFCRLCEIVTLNQDPPLPCPGRKDT